MIWSAGQAQMIIFHVLRDCRNLEEVASCLGYFSTLEMIQVQNCFPARGSIEEIHQVLIGMGNENVKLYIIE